MMNVKEGTCPLRSLGPTRASATFSNGQHVRALLILGLAVVSTHSEVP